jgi:hypothetical protein
MLNLGGPAAPPNTPQALAVATAASATFNPRKLQNQ